MIPLKNGISFLQVLCYQEYPIKFKIDRKMMSQLSGIAGTLYLKTPKL